MKKKLLPGIILPLMMMLSGLVSEMVFSAEVNPEVILASDINLQPVPMGKFYAYLEDPPGILTIDDIVSGKFANSFHQMDRDKPNFGYSRSVYWLRISLLSPSEMNRSFFLEIPFPTLDSVSFYLVEKKSGRVITEFSSGDIKRFSERPIPDKNFVFPFVAPAGKELGIYLRIASRGSLTVGSFLWKPESFYKNSRQSYNAFSIYFGILLALLTYNLLLFISLRDRLYLLYVFFVAAMALGQGSWSGLFFEYLWPDWPALGNLAAVFGFNATGFFGALFSRSFLNTRKTSPVLDKVLILFSGMFLLWALGIVFIPYQINSILTSFTGVGFSLTAVIAGINVARKGFSAAKIFLVAWTFLLVGTALLGARNLNILPTNIFTAFSMLYGSAFEMILLSFALAERIKLINHEKDVMKLEALKHKQAFEIGRNQLASLRTKTNVIEKELSLARDIQFRMIPIKSPSKQIQSLYLPMEKIGGDFFDIIVLDESRIGIFISDVSGHGIPAALITVMLKSMILVGINELNFDKTNSWLMDPSRFMMHMNNSLHGHLSDNFTTAFYGIFDKQDRSFVYSSAAHPPPILLVYKGHQEKMSLNFLNVSPQAPPFGVYFMNSQRPVIAVNRTILPENSRLILYSDGLMDNAGYDFMNSDTGLASFEKTFLHSLFLESVNLNLQTFLETLSIQLLLHRDMGLEDDVCVVALEV